jgi:hypothetical protein
MAAGKSFYDYSYEKAFGGAVNDEASYLIGAGTIKALYNISLNPSALNVNNSVLVPYSYFNDNFHNLLL